MKSRETLKKLVPFDTDTRHSAECRVAFELEDGGSSVVPTFEPIDSQYPVDGMDEPNFWDASAFVGRQFDDLVVARRGGRQNFSNPVGGTAHAAFIELATVTDDEDVWLHDCIDLLVRFVRLRQADIKGGNIGAAGFGFESHPDLMIQLPNDLLMGPRGRGRLSDVRDAIDQFIALTVGPSEVVGVSEVVRCIALRKCHTDILFDSESISREPSAPTRRKHGDPSSASPPDDQRNRHGDGRSARTPHAPDHTFFHAPAAR